MAYPDPGSGGYTDFTFYHAKDGSGCVYSATGNVWFFIDGSSSENYWDYPDAPTGGWANLAQRLNNTWNAIAGLTNPSGRVLDGSASGIRN